MSKAAIRIVLIALGITAAAANVTPVMPIAVIVNTSNPTDEITANRLRDVLLGSVREWPNRRRITVVEREANSPVAMSVLKGLLGMSAQEYNRYLLNQEFRGGEPIALKTLLSDESACNFVFNAPGAIGFVSAEALANIPCAAQVRIVHVPGKPEFSMMRKRQGQ